MPCRDLIQKCIEKRATLRKLSAPQLLESLMEAFGHRIIQSNSLSIEDVAIMHMMHTIDPSFKSFTLDTGRLNPETYDLMARLMEKYDLDLEILFPDRTKVEAMVKEKGINLFYESVDNRKLCCHIRKVEPLNRVLARYSGWVTGLRREQAVSRHKVEKIQLDGAHGDILKINPLADLSFDEVFRYVKKNGIPYNRLYDKGYRSIGCAPCTRAIQPGEPERTGRWWWEDGGVKECGIHFKN